MKKTFVTPALGAVEFSSDMDVMLMSANLAEKKTNILYDASFSDGESDGKFGYWGGKKDGWV